MTGCSIPSKLFKPTADDAVCFWAAWGGADSTSVVKNLLQSLFSQCSVTMNWVSVSSSKDLYNYRAYLETLLTYGHYAKQTHRTSTLWYTDQGDFMAYNPPDDTNRVYHARWLLIYKSAEIEMYCRVHGDLFNVPRLLPPVVQLQIKFTKS